MLLCHEIIVIVPIELGEAGVSHLPEESLLYFLQEVEADEDVMLEIEVRHFTLYDIAVKHALVGQSVFPQTVSESVVERSEILPDVVELLLQDGFSFHFAEELLQTFILLFGEEGEVAHLLPCLKVDEQFVGFHKVLVEVIEVGEHELSPREEMVEGLLAACELHVFAVKAEDELYLVGHLQVGMLAEEVTDRYIGRAPDGVSRFVKECLVEEERCTFVREYHGDVGKVLHTVLGDDIFGDVL